MQAVASLEERQKAAAANDDDDAAIALRDKKKVCRRFCRGRHSECACAFVLCQGLLALKERNARGEPGVAELLKAALAAI